MNAPVPALHQLATDIAFPSQQGANAPRGQICTEEFVPNPNSVVLGTIRMGRRKDEIMELPLVDIKRHILCIGSSGSGKTWTMKVLAEGLLCRGIPILAIDAMGDLTSLALPTRCPEDYDRFNLKRPGMHFTNEDWDNGAATADVLEQVIYPRILTPLIRKGEQIAITPLTSRPAGWDTLWNSDREDLTMQASAQAFQFLTRMGIKIDRSPGKPPSHDLAATTEILIRCWQEDVDLSGPGGFMEFGERCLMCSDVCLTEKGRDTIQAGLGALKMGDYRLWFEGAAFDLDRLMSAPEGKVPLIIVSINHLDAQDRPWVIGQITHMAANWCASKGPSPSRPRLGLLIDELAGDGGANVILPHGNVRNHPSGSAIKRVLRQGRHYGLTLIAGSQSAGDIDYKSFNNFNTRIIGRLASRDDVEKCIYGLPTDQRGSKKLTEYITGAKPGNLFVIPSSGEWECVRMRMLGCADSSVLKDDFPHLYEKGIWVRRMPQTAPSSYVELTIAEQFERDVIALTERYDGRIPPYILEKLRAAAENIPSLDERVAAAGKPSPDEDLFG